jgi:hypothetical protein
MNATWIFLRELLALQNISLQVHDTDRCHCQNRASIGMKIPISRC